MTNREKRLVQKACPICKGEKKVYNANTGNDMRCVICKGKGYITFRETLIKEHKPVLYRKL